MLSPNIYRSWTPGVDDVLGVRREMDRWLDRFLTGTSQSLQPWSPVVDVKETENELIVTAELPGIDPADVDVTVQNGVLTISGEKKYETDSADLQGTYHLNERRYGRFERSFTLLQSVVADDIRANFVNGVLTVLLPKTAEAKPRRIQIDGSGQAVAIGPRKGAR
jgi:HSP20 family protein